MSSVGSWIIGAGFLIMLYYLVKSLRGPMNAPDNPWGGLSLEWMTSTPPPPENFHVTPDWDHGPYDFADAARKRIADEKAKKDEST